jgi:pyridoxal phosphate enzyme (YggS family)
MSISDNLALIKADIPSNVKLVAISKTKSILEIMEAYNAGQRYFGENKVQELVSKYEILPKDIQWHMVGHLQTNKVKYIAAFIHLIHSVDSLSLLKEINKQAIKHNRIINCLLQVYIATEETKFGLSEPELKDMIESSEFKELTNIKVIGLMGIASFTDDSLKIKSEFHKLAHIFQSVKTSYFMTNPDFTELSMGMSTDYHLAIEEGATLIRVGSKLFGERNYSTTI